MADQGSNVRGHRQEVEPFLEWNKKKIHREREGEMKEREGDGEGEGHKEYSRSWVYPSVTGVTGKSISTGEARDTEGDQKRKLLTSS